MADNTRTEVLAVLATLHAAQAAHDVDAMLAVYADVYVSQGGMRSYFEGMIERGAFQSRTIDLTAAEVFCWRDTAMVKPVVYRTNKGPRAFSFHFDRTDAGDWRIVDNRRAHLPGEAIYDPEFLAHAGTVVGSRGMLWRRRLALPVEAVWQAVSTKAGLDSWWLTGDVQIELKVGGRFEHHWSNTISAFEENRFIDFAGVPDDPTDQNYQMGFTLQPDGDGTLFAFCDCFRAHTRPLSLPWTCSGWHGTIDALETALTGRSIGYDFGRGGDFYWDYLRGHHARAERLAGLDYETDNHAWREPYLAAPLQAVDG